MIATFLTFVVFEISYLTVRTLLWRYRRPRAARPTNFNRTAKKAIIVVILAASLFSPLVAFQIWSDWHRSGVWDLVAASPISRFAVFLLAIFLCVTPVASILALSRIMRENGSASRRPPPPTPPPEAIRAGIPIGPKYPSPLGAHAIPPKDAA
jgi:hypothetical protein